MNKKYKSIYPIITLILIIMFSTSFIISSLPSKVNAYSTDDSEYTGKEDPEKILDFDGSVSAMYKYRAWCVFKGMGMNDNQACAALACIEAESSFRSEIVEGNDPLGLGVELGDDASSTDTYVETYSSQIDMNPEFRTRCTDAIVSEYGIPESEIEKCHDGDAANADGTVNPGYNFDSISLSTYYDAAGNGNLGCGLFGFTGGNLKQLFEWSSQCSSRWYDFDTQIAFIIADNNNGGYKGEVFQDWIIDTKNDSLDDCTESFFLNFINNNPDLTEMIEARQDKAANLYEQLEGVAWNYKYAKKICDIAGCDVIGVREGIQDKGIIYSYASTVMYYPRNSGFLVTGILANEDIKEKNTEVWEGYISNLQGNSDTSNTYSLFELYGEDIHWYRYMGETTYTPTLLDHIWCAIDQNKVKDLISFDTIDYDAYNYLSCNVYPNRPLVLTSQDLFEGNKDPRVSTARTGWFNGYLYVDGSIRLAISKFLVSMVSLLIGPEIRVAILDLIEKIESTEVWNAITVPLLVLLGIGIVFFIASILKKSIRYAQGHGAVRDAINRFIVSALCLGLLFAAIARPKVFNNLIDKTLNFVDSIFTETLTATLQDDEVINVTDDSLAVHAVLWKNAIFGPWCRGQFDNRNYDELYTHYSGKDEDHMLPQDNEEIDYDDQTGKPFYNSVEAIGDVYVPVGGGTEIRNWAAYAYSCGTIYHIDSTMDETAVENINLDLGINFPHYTTKTTAGDPDLTADMFRVVDAQMNISPQYYANGSVNENYDRAHKLKTHFSIQGWVALFNCVLLLFMFPVIFKKLKAMILLFLTTLQLIIYSFREIFKEDSGIRPFFESLKKNFIDYFVSALKLNLMVTLYYLFVDKGFMELVLYVICCLVILGFSWRDIRFMKQNIVASVKRATSKL